MFSESLKQKRKELQLTQQEVADQLNVTRQTVSSWEVGKSIPDINTLIKLSELYDISLDTLIKGDTKIINKIKKDTDTVKSNQKVLSTLILVGVSFLLFWLIKSVTNLPQITDPFINGLLVLLVIGFGIFYLLKQTDLLKFKIDLTLLKKVVILLIVLSITFGTRTFINTLISISWQQNIIKVSATFIVAISGYFIFKQEEKD